MDDFKTFKEKLTLLLPLRRSLLGDATDQTIRVLGMGLPMNFLTFNSGEPVFDWTVPKEWVLKSASLKSPSGDVVVDANDSVLNVVNYSTPFSGKLSLEHLLDHLHSIEDKPTAVPYVTSYYAPSWGFCLPHIAKRNLEKGDYQVEIDSEFKEGALTVGEIKIEGETDREIFLTSYVCHPEMVNDEIAAPVALSILANRIKNWSKRKFTYRIVFAPETIGSLCYLKKRGKHLTEKCDAGIVLSNIARDEPLRAKFSRTENSLIDRALEVYFRDEKNTGSLSPFSPFGSDERQYCSPGFDLPICSMSKSAQDFPEYHSSLDNLESCSVEAAFDTVNQLEKLLQMIEKNSVWKNLFPFGEPNLGSRGLYPKLGGNNHKVKSLKPLMWLLNSADGHRDLFHIAILSGIAFSELVDGSDQLKNAGLISEVR